jgi:NADP-dependent 3-hydroxy acid dehydrogenase YdfG
MSSDFGTAVPKYSDVYDFISPQKLAGSLNGKVALITGASRGIGKAMALAFAEAGADVALLARGKAALESVASTIRETYGRRALVLVTDVTDEKGVHDAVKTAEWELGSLDVVIANAGANIERPFVLEPMDEWWRIMEVNVKGQLLVAQAAMKSMRGRGKGVIILTTSGAALVNICKS